MARTPSNMLALNTPAPNFALIEPATGLTVRLSDFIGQPIVVAFICNHCPYVIQIREVFAQMATEYQKRGVTAIIFKEIWKKFKKKGVKYLETNPELEENKNIQLLWQDYNPVNHKRRRTYGLNL